MSQWASFAAHLAAESTLEDRVHELDVVLDPMAYLYEGRTLAGRP